MPIAKYCSIILGSLMILNIVWVVIRSINGNTNQNENTNKSFFTRAGCNTLIILCGLSCFGSLKFLDKYATFISVILFVLIQVLLVFKGYIMAKYAEKDQEGVVLERMVFKDF